MLSLNQNIERHIVCPTHFVIDVWCVNLLWCADNYEFIRNLMEKLKTLDASSTEKNTFAV